MKWQAASSEADRVRSVAGAWVIRSALRALRRLGVPLPRSKAQQERLRGMDAEFLDLYERCRKLTMTGPERMYALYQAANYVTRAGIEGDVVECGVWRGGSSMLAALALLRANDRGRTLYLYDTFEGMTQPTDKDVSIDGQTASARWEALRHGEGSAWCEASLEDVRHNLTTTGYPSSQLRFVKGKVETTIPAILPERIALLRLDTDWYESTRHELEHLFPRLATGGVLIIDDYGHWQGVREAVDEYFAAQRLPLLLHRIDYTGRIAIKPSPRE